MAEQLSLFITPSPVGNPYLCFTQDHDQADALRRYRQRFGVEPSEIRTEKRVLWLGPIPAKERYERGEE